METKSQIKILSRQVEDTPEKDRWKRENIQELKNSMQQFNMYNQNFKWRRNWNRRHLEEVRKKIKLNPK